MGVVIFVEKQGHGPCNFGEWHGFWMARVERGRLCFRDGFLYK
jgi:hypothetical protein